MSSASVLVSCVFWRQRHRFCAPWKAPRRHVIVHIHHIASISPTMKSSTQRTHLNFFPWLILSSSDPSPKHTKIFPHRNLSAFKSNRNPTIESSAFRFRIFRYHSSFKNFGFEYTICDFTWCFKRYSAVCHVFVTYTYAIVEWTFFVASNEFRSSVWD